MKYLLLYTALLLNFQLTAQKTINGRITKRGGGVLSGAKISAKDAPMIFTLSDKYGHYKIEIPEEVSSLVFSYSGMADKTVKIKDFTDINVKLTPAQYKKFRYGLGLATGTSRFLVFSENADKIKDTTKIILTPISLHAEFFYRFRKNLELQTTLEDGLNFAKFIDSLDVTTKKVILNRFTVSLLLNYHFKLDRTGNHSIFAGFGPQYQHLSFLNTNSVGVRFQSGVNINNYGKTTKIFLAFDVSNGKFGSKNVYVPDLPYKYLSSRLGFTFIF